MRRTRTRWPGWRRSRTTTRTDGEDADDEDADDDDADDEAQTLVRGPYLQSGTASSVIIKWRTDEATDSVVRYGLAPDSLTLSATNSTSTTEHAVQLTGLSADVQVLLCRGHLIGTLAGGDRDHFVVTLPSPGRRSRRESGSSEIPAPPTGMPEPSGMPFSISRVARPGPLDHAGRQRLLRRNRCEYRKAVSIPTRRCCPGPCSGRRSETMTATADSTTESGPYYDIFSLLATAKPAVSPPGRKPITPLTTGICTSFAWTPTEPTTRRTGR